MAGTPQVLPMLGGGPQVIGIKLVEPSAAQVQLLSGGRGRQFIAPKSSKDFTDQGCAQTVRELAIVFFIVAKMREWQPNNESAIPALRAFRRPPLRSGLLQARRAGRVRLCSHTCRGLNAHCSPLLATQQLFFSLRQLEYGPALVGDRQRAVTGIELLQDHAIPFDG